MAKKNILVEKLIEKNLDAAEIIEKIWMEVFNHANWNFFIKCPFHKDWKETKPSCHVKDDWTTFHCFSCNTAWTIFKIIMKKNKCSIKEALKIAWIPIDYELEKLVIESTKKEESLIEKELDLFNELEQLSKSLNSCSKKNINKESNERKEVYIDNWTKELQNLLEEEIIIDKVDSVYEEKNEIVKDLLKKIKEDSSMIHPFLNNFSKETIAKYELVFNKKNNSLLIPVKNTYGDYIWIYNKNFNEKFEQKYYSSISFTKKDNIFNLNNIKDSMKDIILVEWPLNAIKLIDFGFDNVISLYWAAVSNNQIELLKTKLKQGTLTIWFDDDEAWNNWKERIVKSLKNYKQLFEIKAEWRKDAFDYTKDEIINLIKNRQPTISL